MSQPHPLVRLVPVTAPVSLRNPKILLGGNHQPTLLRYLDGWPRRKGRASAFLIQFAQAGDNLERFASNHFDLAVIQSPGAELAEQVIRNLVRVSRQGLIALR
ncbi:class I SAM-dependent methyltransferase [Pseudomonas sp.]|uniref:class I SAM-dependent methyltransferase n=1 Tax=Pseudomonas sp. TaxID=306 RepID=UPI00260E0A38|nr:class I SAM-dependent methyltransferase [Pseudomonas sp.]